MSTQSSTAQKQLPSIQVTTPAGRPLEAKRSSGSLPRAKSSRGRPRKAPPPPEVSQLQRLKQSRYFVPALVAGVAIFVCLLVAAIRIASHSSEITERAVSKAQEPKAGPSTPPLIRIPTRAEEQRAAREALERTWDLEAAALKQREAARASQPEKVGMGEEELAAAKERFEQLKKDMEELDADSLTSLLDQMYRPQ